MLRKTFLMERYIYSAWSSDDGVNIWAENFGRMTLLETRNQMVIHPAKRLRELESSSQILDMSRIAHAPNIQIWSVPSIEQAKVLFSKFGIEKVIPDKTGLKWNYVVIDTLLKEGGFVISSDVAVEAFSLPEITLKDISWQLLV